MSHVSINRRKKQHRQKEGAVKRGRLTAGLARFKKGQRTLPYKTHGVLSKRGQNLASILTAMQIRANENKKKEK